MSGKIDPKYLNQEILGVLKAYREQARALIGRRIRVTSFYNGQPMGCSKPNLEGTELVIRNADVGDHGLTIIPEGHRVWMHIDQWELLP